MIDNPHLCCADGSELHGLAIDFAQSDGADLLARWNRCEEFWDARLAAGLDPYFRVSLGHIGPECQVLTRGRERVSGVNFASQDYLSLAAHPDLRQAAVEAIERWGVHSGGSAAVQGGSIPLLRLEERLAEFLCCHEAAVFPSGWAAGYGAIRALVREQDHVVIDTLAHDCLQEGAGAATPHVHRVPHCSHEAITSRLSAIRSGNANAGILVVTESLFSLDSSVPDLRAIQQTCHDHQATLLVNIANDFGAIGNGGLGFVGEQAMTGEVDVVMGSFGKTFASSGGFVASRAPGLRQALGALAGPYLSSNALSPMQASIVLAALNVVRSREGTQRRRRLLRNILRLREGLESRAFQVIGRPSGIVPVLLGDVAQARIMTREALAGGGLVTLVEHPAVSRASSRWRLHLSADHSVELIDKFISIAVAAREQTPTFTNTRPTD